MTSHLDWLRKRRPTGTPTRLKVTQSGLVAYASPVVEANAAAMSARVVISTPRLDHSRDIVVGSGIDTSVHAKNPLVLVEHNRVEPAGLARDPEGQYTVQVNDDQTIATTYFARNTLAGEQAFRLVEAGLLNGGSVGISTQPGDVQKHLDGEGRPYCVIERSLLMEYSHVFFPDNPDALIVAVQKSWGGKPLVDCLVKAIKRHLPKRTSVTVPTRLFSGLSLARWKGDSMTRHRPAANATRRKNNDLPPDVTPDVTAPADEEPTIPLGAMLFQELYELFLGAAERVEDVFAQLEPESQEAMTDLPAMLEANMQTIADKFSERYPDLPPLSADEPDEDEPAEDDTAPDDATDVTDEDDSNPAPEEDKSDTPDEEPKDDDDMAKRWRGPSRRRIVKFWAARQKKLSKSASSAVADAADHLDDAASATEWTRQYKAASRYHAKALRALCKADDDADDTQKSQRIGGSPIDLSSVAQMLEATTKRVAETSNALTKLGV